MDNKIKYEEKLINYQQIIDNERNNVKNSDNIISRLKSELEYVKEKNIIESKIIKEEIFILKKKITELNEKLNNVDNTDSEDNNENIQENKNYYKNNDINNNKTKKINININDKKDININTNKFKNYFQIGIEDDINYNKKEKTMNENQNNNIKN